MLVWLVRDLGASLVRDYVFCLCVWLVRYLISLESLNSQKPHNSWFPKYLTRWKLTVVPQLVRELIFFMVSDRDERDLGLKTETETSVVSRPVSSFETSCQKSQYQSQNLRFIFKSISISLKFWDHNAKVSVSVSKCNCWSRSSLILEPSKKVNFVSTFHWFIC